MSMGSNPVGVATTSSENSSSKDEATGHPSSGMARPRPSPQTNPVENIVGNKGVPTVGDVVEVYLSGGGLGWYRRQVYAINESMGAMAVALPGAKDWHASELWVRTDGAWRWPETKADDGEIAEFRGNAIVLGDTVQILWWDGPELERRADASIISLAGNVFTAVEADGTRWERYLSEEGLSWQRYQVPQKTIAGYAQPLPAELAKGDTHGKNNVGELPALCQVPGCGAIQNPEGNGLCSGHATARDLAAAIPEEEEQPNDGQPYSGIGIRCGTCGVRVMPGERNCSCKVRICKGVPGASPDGQCDTALGPEVAGDYCSACASFLTERTDVLKESDPHVRRGLYKGVAKAIERAVPGRDVIADAVEAVWEALAEDPDLDPRTVAVCKRLRDIDLGVRS
jgi:hypothetical protein